MWRIFNAKATPKSYKFPQSSQSVTSGCGDILQNTYPNKITVASLYVVFGAYSIFIY